MSQHDTNLAYDIAQLVEAHKAVNPEINIGVVLGQVAAVFSIPNAVFTHVDGKDIGAELQHQLQEAGK